MVCRMNVGMATLFQPFVCLFRGSLQMYPLAGVFASTRLQIAMKRQQKLSLFSE